MSLSLFKNLLSHDFYSNNQTRLDPKLWEGDLNTLYGLIDTSHQKYEQDLSSAGLLHLYKEAHPVATKAETDMIASLIEDIATSEPLSAEIASDVLSGLWKREAGRKIANLGLEISEGNYDGFDRLNTYLSRLEEGFAPDEFTPVGEFDLDALLKEQSDEGRWKFNIGTLSRKVYGIGATEFAVILATPNVGKTAFCLSLGAGQEGFARQGAQCLYIVNEEAHTRQQARSVSTYTGFTKDEMLANPKNKQAALDLYRAHGLFDKVEFRSAMGWDLAKLEACIKSTKADVVFVDQADKVSVRGTFEANHHKLRELYLQLREIAKRQNCAIFAVSQANSSAVGRTRVSPNDAEGSKIGKFAEADLVLGIGKYDDDNTGDSGDDEANNSRFITVGKNKLNGYHGTITCRIDADRSRYVE